MIDKTSKCREEGIVCKGGALHFHLVTKDPQFNGDVGLKLPDSCVSTHNTMHKKNMSIIICLICYCTYTH